MAYAQLEQQQRQRQAADSWSEALSCPIKSKSRNNARSVWAWCARPAYPTTQDLLMVFGVAAVGSMLVCAIVNHLLNRSKAKTKSEQPIASAS